MTLTSCETIFAWQTQFSPLSTKIPCSASRVRSRFPSRRYPKPAIPSYDQSLGQHLLPEVDDCCLQEIDMADSNSPLPTGSLKQTLIRRFIAAYERPNPVNTVKIADPRIHPPGGETK